MSKIIKFSQAINEGLSEAMSQDSRVIVYGLGVPDPKSVFGTTSGLRERFGHARVFDTPTSENAMTGIAVGAAITGLRPVLTHQRLDFFLLAMDQLINNASKWYYMFGGKVSVPVTIRLIIGRGWGQGPTHSQSLQSWFAHIPGLKVVMPAFAKDAKGLLLSSIFDDNPVVFIEHRWLHNLEGEVPDGNDRIPLGKAALLREGQDLTLVGMSLTTLEALKVSDELLKQGISSDVIDLRSISPLDWETIFKSVRKTGRIFVIDTSWPVCSVSSEIVAQVAMELWDHLKQSPQRIALPSFPVPTGFSLTKEFYPTIEKIVKQILDMFKHGKRKEPGVAGHAELHDIPGTWFKGPF
jgi:pyruvate/2-oxoglutarate/acetoin dehydrogenase E1 component